MLNAIGIIFCILNAACAGWLFTYWPEPAFVATGTVNALVCVQLAVTLHGMIRE